MAGEDDGQDKTEQPTQKRLLDARKEGQVPRSRELGGAAMLGISVLVLLTTGAHLTEQAGSWLRHALTPSREQLLRGDPIAHVGELLFGLFWPALPLMLAGALAGALAPLVLGGFNFSAKALAPKFSKLNPIEGIKRVFGAKGLLETGTGGPNGGLHITDVTNASRTQLVNIFNVQWDQEVLYRFNIPKSMLPEIVPSSRVYGVITAEPLRGIPLAGDLGDQQAALLGQVCLSPGEAKNTYGTGCFMLMNTGEKVVPSRFGLLTTVAYQFDNAPVHFALEGSVAIAGALVQWLRDNLGLIQHSSEIESLARSVDDNGGAYFVPAFSGLYAPYWKSDARGVIAGLTRYVNKGHIARAALEATAFQTREVLDAMEKDSGIRLSSLRVDGGMVVNELLMQFQADILGVPVIRPKMIETTALGAAYAAGLAVGYWSGFDDLKRNWGIDKTWEPQMEDEQRKHLYLMWHKAVERSFDWEEGS